MNRQRRTTVAKSRKKRLHYSFNMATATQYIARQVDREAAQLIAAVAEAGLIQINEATDLLIEMYGHYIMNRHVDGCTTDRVRRTVESQNKNNLQNTGK